MRRLWILLLALMLPLQMTWAAAHGYAHDAGAAGHAALQIKAEAAVSSDAAADHQSEAGEHSCCDMAHSCHGSATLMPTFAIQVGSDARNLLSASNGAFMLQMLASRHERPQWAPA
jgi:hypothetical protein